LSLLVASIVYQIYEQGINFNREAPLSVAILPTQLRLGQNFVI
jgi:hypothetical protein